VIDYGIPLRPRDRLPIGRYEDRFRHFYCIGRTQSGKSVYLANLLKQTLEYATVIVDPYGGLARIIAALTPAERLIYVDLDHPLIINPLTRYRSMTAAYELFEIVNNAVLVTTASKEFTVLMREILVEAIKIFREPGHFTFDYLYRFLTFSDVRQSHPVKNEYWAKFETREQHEKQQSTKRVATRIHAFYNDEDLLPFVSGNDQFNLADIARNRKIVCFNFHGLKHDQLVFIGNAISSALVTYYRKSARERGDPLFVAFDEFHLFASRNFSQMLVEAAKYHISVNLSNHSLSQLDRLTVDTALSCYTKAVFTCDHESSKRLSSEMGLEPEAFRKLEPYRAYLQIGNETCLIDTFPPPGLEPYSPEPVSMPQANETCSESVYFLREQAWFSV
jgi:DNA helicase HerA-like ATPase